MPFFLVVGKKAPYKAVSEEEYTKIKVAEGWPPFVVEFAKGWVHGMNIGEWADRRLRNANRLQAKVSC
jgi:hypothetical protein